MPHSSNTATIPKTIIIISNPFNVQLTRGLEILSSKFFIIKEELAVSIIEIVEANNAGFAFPSQSIYVESFPNEKSEIFNPKTVK